MFGNLGGAAAGDLAMEAFEDDIQLTSRTVRIYSLVFFTLLLICHSWLRILS